MTYQLLQIALHYWKCIHNITAPLKERLSKDFLLITFSSLLLAAVFSAGAPWLSGCDARRGAREAEPYRSPSSTLLGSADCEDGLTGREVLMAQFIPTIDVSATSLGSDPGKISCVMILYL
ncbi:hypothetical protein KIN20_012141 [Parelaphostrongylus tenuis]|uniref:Uncharacterized protein n=1 Tax=Parelaphostrongylus tenuis TaxID=148309 RepID=A0AAD5MBS4_PARTN|nr:hypothetical protein KIN20_012141 [Parelaphostrongylus tenuis]